MSNSMQDIISDVRHSADVDKYTKEQRKFLWSIADRLEAARESEGGGAVEIGEILHDYERVSVCWTINPKYGQFEPGEKVYVGRPPKQQSGVPEEITYRQVLHNRDLHKGCWNPHGMQRYADGWNDCRAAMPSATSQPDKWIPCSKLLPTEADADEFGKISILIHEESEAFMLPWQMVEDSMWLWTSTGLTRPTPPEQESE